MLFQVRFPRYNASAFKLVLVLSRWKRSLGHEPLPPMPYESAEAIPEEGDVYWIAVKPPTTIVSYPNSHIVIVDVWEQVPSGKNIKVIRLNSKLRNLKYVEAAKQLGFPTHYLRELVSLYDDTLPLGEFLTLTKTVELVDFYLKIGSVPEIGIEYVKNYIRSVVEEKSPLAESAYRRARKALAGKIFVIEVDSFYAYVREKALREAVKKGADTVLVIRTEDSVTHIFFRSVDKQRARALATKLAKQLGNCSLKGKTSIRPVLQFTKRVSLEEVLSAISAIESKSRGETTCP